MTIPKLMTKNTHRYVFYGMILKALLLMTVLLSAQRLIAQEVALSDNKQTQSAKVIVGAYINDIQALDLKTHSYVVDLYVWFRWKEPSINPIETFEFMNTFDPEAHVQHVFYDEPQAQPDGSFYNLVRYQGAFSSKFNVSKYPFDTQQIKVKIEDSEYGSDQLEYVADVTPITINNETNLPGYKLDPPTLNIHNKRYPTAFGDLANPNITTYSSVTISITLNRPLASSAIKHFLPVLLIVLCAGLAMLLDPTHVEARVGLSITALLTLVALQLTSTSNLPEVGYLLMLDQIYIASYLYILIVISFVVYSTRVDEQGAIRGGFGALNQLVTSGPKVAAILAGVYFLGILTIGILNNLAT